MYDSRGIMHKQHVHAHMQALFRHVEERLRHWSYEPEEEDMYEDLYDTDDWDEEDDNAQSQHLPADAVVPYRPSPWWWWWQTVHQWFSVWWYQ